MRKSLLLTVLLTALAMVGAGAALAYPSATRSPVAAAAPRPKPAPAVPQTAAPAPTKKAPAPQDTSKPVSYVHGGVALTIDDGPSPTYTPQLLDLLKQYGVHATFCLIGEQARAHPDLVRRIAEDGHALCNHTEDHDEHLGTKSEQAQDSDIEQGAQAIADATGQQPRYFRAPGGGWTPSLLAAARQHGETPLNWSVDTEDWQRPGTAAIVAALKQAENGDVVLVHDGGGDRSQTIAALEQVLPEWSAAGVSLVIP